MTEGTNEITAEEVALYDRQIRLWGMEAQNRMRNSNILLINLGAVASEVAKNIVLAGVGSLTIMDTNTVSEDDLGANFFLRDDDVGKNRGLAGRDRVQNLNKRVKVDVVEKKLDQVEASWISTFDIVVATELTYKELEFVNQQTRAGNKHFYATGLIGYYGYVFADLIEHIFKIEREKPNKATVIGPETATSTIVSAEARKDSDKNMEIVTKIEKYTSLKDVLENAATNSQFGQQFRARKLAKISPLLPAVLAMWESQRTETQLTNESVKNISRSLQLPVGIVTDRFYENFTRFLGAEIAPVAAVIGGVLGQDILNVLARKEQPIQNFFLYNGDNAEGPIYTL